MSSTHRDTLPPLWGEAENGEEPKPTSPVSSWPNVKSHFFDEKVRLLVFLLFLHGTGFSWMCHTAACWLCFSCRTRLSKGLSPLFSRSGFLLASASGFLHHPSPPSKLQAFPPSFSPCLLSFLPPAQTFSQTQRVSGKYDRILS